MINANCTCLGLSGCEFRETSLGFLPMVFSLPKVSPIYSLKHTAKKITFMYSFWELRGLSPNFHIHVTVSGLYIPRISPQQNRLIDPGNI
jgi:hypothetical protein